METLTIRELEKTDLEMMKEFFAQMSPETNALFNPRNCNYMEMMKFFEDREVAEDHKRWIGVENGRIIGYVFLWHTMSGVPELGIVLAENMQGRHLSRQFMDVAVDWCRENGKGGVMLTTHTANFRAQMLYEKYGFERMGLNTFTELLYLYRFGEQSRCWN